MLLWKSMTAARTSLPSSAIIIRRYTGKPGGRYRASPGRLGCNVICSSPRPPSLRRWLNRATAGMSSSAAKRIFMISTPTIFIGGEDQLGDFQVQERPADSSGFAKRCCFSVLDHRRDDPVVAVCQVPGDSD